MLKTGTPPSQSTVPTVLVENSKSTVHACFELNSSIDLRFQLYIGTARKETETS